MSEKISAVIHANNEEALLPRLFESLKGIDDIVLVDHTSTDGTAKLAKKLGARVFTWDNVSEPVSNHDVMEFEKRYGFTPTYKAGNRMPHFGTDRNNSMEQALHDWVFFPDCDEIVTWDLDKVKKLLPDNDIVTCKFIHTRHPDGTEGETFTLPKLFRKSKVWWQGRLHEAIIGHGLRITHSDDMVINHYQVPREHRQIYLPVMEFAMVREADTRLQYYLGREYFNYQMFERAIQFLTIYLKTAYDTSEMVKAYIIIATSYWKLGDEDRAIGFCMQALKKDPSSKEALLFMADISRPKDARIWRKYASIDTSDIV